MKLVIQIPCYNEERTIPFTIGFQLGLLTLLADLIAVNRSIIEEVHYRLRKTGGEDREKSG